jgi:hypothetical protein
MNDGGMRHCGATADGDSRCQVAVKVVPRFGFVKIPRGQSPLAADTGNLSSVAPLPPANFPMDALGGKTFGVRGLVIVLGKTHYEFDGNR